MTAFAASPARRPYRLLSKVASSEMLGRSEGAQILLYDRVNALGKR
jgi:hypothetical protein